MPLAVVILLIYNHRHLTGTPSTHVVEVQVLTDHPVSVLAQPSAGYEGLTERLRSRMVVTNPGVPAGDHETAPQVCPQVVTQLRHKSVRRQRALVFFI